MGKGDYGVKRGPCGAFWFAFANFACFVFALLVLLANRFEKLTIFAIIPIDLHPEAGFSYRGYSYSSSPYSDYFTAENYTIVNPATNQLEEPRYLFISFSGVCHIFENYEDSTPDYSYEPDFYSKNCTAKFLQPLFIPNGTFYSVIDSSVSNYTVSNYTFNIAGLDIGLYGGIKIPEANRYWTATAALLIMLMVYNVVAIGLCSAGYWYPVCFKWFWILGVVIMIPCAILCFFAQWRLLNPFGAGLQVYQLGYSFVETGPARNLGLFFFWLAMFCVLIAHPTVLIVIVGLAVWPLALLIACCIGCCEEEETTKTTTTYSPSVAVQPRPEPQPMYAVMVVRVRRTLTVVT
ncbi:hypothetical protein ABW19_dt0210098 [Dactylella cylindrospora]|nr:hypothetical protein ABW19_dt0210098 [Dactylella cylindrospora]